MFGAMNFMENLPGHFSARYRCWSVSMMPSTSDERREQADTGGKIFLPPSALDQLTRLHINYPMLFKLTNTQTSRTTHSGVLEFTADEGKVFLPYWMMQNLMLDEGGLLKVESVTLPVATFAKFQPHSVDFLDLANPKAVLESTMRHFACISKDDVIAIHYNGRTYEMSVLETKPAAAVTVIECDLNVDFAPPVGYQEPDWKGTGGGGGGSGEGKMEQGDDDEEEEHLNVAELMPENKDFQAFSGNATRLDGKNKTRTQSECDGPPPTSNPEAEYVRGIPDEDFKIGTLRFIRGRPKKPNSGDDKDKNGDDGSNGFEAFKGEGRSLRKK